MAFLVVLDSMTPAERVAVILHDVFGYAFAEVAEITGRAPGNMTFLERTVNTATALSIVAARCEEAGIAADLGEAGLVVPARPGLTGTVEFAVAGFSRGG
jgi:RNA polymerase sigma-70 factor (ECF subfamily)